MESYNLDVREEAWEVCFNSLQTGRYMERKWRCVFAVGEDCYGFNSLQTGRSMESAKQKADGHALTNVSIPFKREGAWKESLKRLVKNAFLLGFNSLQTGRSMES